MLVRALGGFRRRLGREARAGLVAVVALPLAGLALTACYASPPKVVVYGDSLGIQAENDINFLLSQNNAAQVFDNIFPGTAPCSWMSQMLSDANSSVQPSAAVLEFSGFTGLGCMTAPYGSELYYIAYDSQVTEATDAFISHGTHVFLIGYPIDYTDVDPNDYSVVTNPEWDILNQIYQQIAAQNPGQVTYVDAGSSVMTGPTAPPGTPGAGTFTWTLPCLSFEPACGVGPLAGPGQNQVRASDGIHFCPGVAPGIGNTCSVYSSGSLRYALAIASPVISWLAANPDA